METVQICTLSVLIQLQVSIIASDVLLQAPSNNSNVTWRARQTNPQSNPLLTIQLMVLFNSIRRLSTSLSTYWRLTTMCRIWTTIFTQRQINISLNSVVWRCKRYKSLESALAANDLEMTTQVTWSCTTQCISRSTKNLTPSQELVNIHSRLLFVNLWDLKLEPSEKKTNLNKDLRPTRKWLDCSGCALSLKLIKWLWLLKANLTLWLCIKRPDCLALVCQMGPTVYQLAYSSFSNVLTEFTCGLMQTLLVKMLSRSFPEN